jgi:hypothetical protein
VESGVSGAGVGFRVSALFALPLAGKSDRVGLGAWIGGQRGTRTPDILLVRQAL